MKEKRPDPDQLLKAVSKELKQEGRGHLKIFLGAYAGVGKTYAMLQAARQQLEKGLKVEIGIIETHDREETERLLEGFRQLPLRSIPFQGRVIQDFDLDAALSSGANLVLVTLRGWLFVPGANGPAPAITMAHGYAGVKEHGLERFARAFAEAVVDDGATIINYGTLESSNGTNFFSLAPNNVALRSILIGSWFRLPDEEKQKDFELALSLAKTFPSRT